MKYTTESFIKRAAEKHGDKYDYSSTVYNGSTQRILVICHRHGPFCVKAKDHLYGKGCKSCGYDNQRMSLDEFKTRASLIHNSKFNYDDVILHNISTEIKIVCPTHGVFKQTPASHLSGSGCLRCAHDSLRFTTKIFIERANEIHGNYYDYSKSIYAKSGNRLTIICPIHGEFEQIAGHHLKGHGCKKCTQHKSLGETLWLDILNVPAQYRQVSIKRAVGKDFLVDGFDPSTKTIYEYNGSYFHGDPRLNLSDKKSIEYIKTLEKEAELIQSGYTVITMWELDFIDYLKYLSEEHLIEIFHSSEISPDRIKRWLYLSAKSLKSKLK